jgi:hypothetical protein
MIQQRDIYENDYINKYVPALTLEKFSYDMFAQDKQQKKLILFNKEDNEKQSQLYNSQLYGGKQYMPDSGLSVFGTSIATILLHDRIPLIRRLQRKWPRRFYKMAIFFIPIQIFAAFSEASQMALVSEIYSRNIINYHKFLLNGDVVQLSPSIRISDV